MKDRPARFCLQFNTGDPVQSYAYRVISGKGRKKSAFIAEAVKFYMENSPDSTVGTAADNGGSLRELIRETVREMLPEYAAAEKTSPKNDPGSPGSTGSTDSSPDQELADMLLEGLSGFGGQI